MHIYPYVYKLTHKVTGQFYFGYRCANKVNSTYDLGIHYFSSSYCVKELGFENFDSLVIAEFFDKSAAIEFENKLISEEWRSPLILNKGYGGEKFRNYRHSDATREKISIAKKGKPRPEEQKLKTSVTMKGHKTSDETRRKISIALAGKSKGVGRKMSAETKDKLRQYRLNLSAEAKANLSIAQKNRYRASPMSAETKLKISTTHKSLHHPVTDLAVGDSANT